MKKLVKKININQIRTMNVLLLTSVMLIVGYLYLVNSIAFTTANYEKVSKNISNIQTEIAMFEATLINTTKIVTLETGYEMNLVKSSIADATFIDRAPNTILTVNE